MKVRVHWIASSKRGILGAQYTLLILGCAALGFCAFTYSQSALFQAFERWCFERTAASGTRQRETAASVDAHSSLRDFAGEGASLGQIEIPRLGISVILVEGVRPRDLRLAVGHIPGTAFPDEVGNVGIAGHRDTFLRELRRIQRDDLIIVRTTNQSMEYLVEWTRIVKPSSIEVLEASPQPALTLVTCYPFYYVGPAPGRFIVRARRITMSIAIANGIQATKLVVQRSGLGMRLICNWRYGSGIPKPAAGSRVFIIGAQP